MDWGAGKPYEQACHAVALIYLSASIAFEVPKHESSTQNQTVLVFFLILLIISLDSGSLGF